MPEDEAVSGDRWNQRANIFLSALGWEQVGDSNVDIVCSECNRKHGLDSVFLYEVGQESQLVFVEAKTRKWENAYKAEIERWCRNLAEKMQHVPYAPDFRAKFPAIPSRTAYDTGLIILWINDEDNFDPDQMTQRLRAVRLPEYRKNPKRIFVLSNQKILFICAVIDKLRRLRASDRFCEVAFHLPPYGNFDSTTTTTLPLEYIYSKVIFATARRRYQEKSGEHWHELNIVFYSGAVDYESLDLLRLVLRRFQMGDLNRDLHLNFVELTDSTRSAMAQFRRDFENQIAGDVIIDKLTLPATLPGWLTDEIR
jgi:hypothetical protein